MNTPQQQFCNGDYLDVTEFILKEHSPDDSDDSASMPTIQIVVEAASTTPGNHPLQLDPSMISPLLKGLRHGTGNEPTEFELTLSITTENNVRRSSRRKNTISMYWMPTTQQLCDIEEDNHEQFQALFRDSDQSSSSSSSQEEQDDEPESQPASLPSPELAYHSSRMDSMNLEFPTAQTAKQQQRLDIEEFTANLEKVLAQGDFPLLMSYLKLFLTDDEIINLSPINQRKEDIIAAVSDKLRRIGTITAMERREKVQRYLLKRKNRIWSKKVSYDCRKRVADSRLRIKGRFITRKQASKILEQDVSQMSQNQIKELLNQRLNGKVRVGVMQLIDEDKLSEILRL